MELTTYRNKIHNRSKTNFDVVCKKNYSKSAHNFLSIINENTIKYYYFDILLYYTF